MAGFASILVDIDAMAAAHPALDRAIDLARRCGARLTIVDAVQIPAGTLRRLPPGTEQKLIEAREARLADFARGAGGVLAGFAVLRGRPAIVLVQEVLRSGHDLLIRSHARDLAAAPRAYGAIDMQLFRQCPCPVWIIGPGARTAPRNILAAVHANPEDEEEQRLNARILDYAMTMGELHDGSVTAFQAWTAFGEEVLRSHASEAEVDAYVQAAEQAASDALRSLVASMGDRAARVRIDLRKGHPEDAIPEYVVSRGFDLLVMGTVARTGVAGLVIGNTAERVLQRLPVSVMAIKPEGFESPIRLERAQAAAAT